LSAAPCLEDTGGADCELQVGTEELRAEDRLPDRSSAGQHGKTSSVGV